MSWFKVNTDDLHPITTGYAEIKESQSFDLPASLPNIKTKEVTIYIGRYSNLESVRFSSHAGFIMVDGEVSTKTNAKDAFIMAVNAAMQSKGYRPTDRFAFSVSERIVHEAVE